MGTFERVGRARMIRGREPRRRKALLVVAASAVAPIAARGELSQVRIAMARIAALELAALGRGARTMAGGAVDRGMTALQWEAGLAVVERARIDCGPGGLAMAVGAAAAESASMRILVARSAGRSAHVVGEEVKRGGSVPLCRRSAGARRRVRSA